MARLGSDAECAGTDLSERWRRSGGSAGDDRECGSGGSDPVVWLATIESVATAARMCQRQAAAARDLTQSVAEADMCKLILSCSQNAPEEKLEELGVVASAINHESKPLGFLRFMWNPLSWAVEAAAIMTTASTNVRKDTRGKRKTMFAMLLLHLCLKLCQKKRVYLMEHEEK